jgi:hypothetical protein
MPFFSADASSSTLTFLLSAKLSINKSKGQTIMLIASAILLTRRFMFYFDATALSKSRLVIDKL